MDERTDLARSLKQLIELDRALGVEFVGRAGDDGAADAPTPRAAAAPAAPAASAAIGSASGSSAGVGRSAPGGIASGAPDPVSTAPAPIQVPAMAFPGDALGRPRLLPTWQRPPEHPPTGEVVADLAAIASEAAVCTACALCTTRTRTVPGEGAAAPELVFVGEGPGADEDAQGRPFVGKAGELLTRMIEAMGLARSDVFIMNVVKCRPPGNRTPEPDEVAACMPYLHRQIAALRPKVICTLGNTPLRALLANDRLGITKVRGQRFAFAGITLIPTFHPSFLLRNPPAKKPCWEDLQVVLKELGRTAPRRGAVSGG